MSNEDLKEIIMKTTNPQRISGAIRAVIVAVLTILAINTLLSLPAFSYNIGGAYATLEHCEWTQYGYQYGYVGTYSVHGQYYQIFFGSSYCEY